MKLGWVPLLIFLICLPTALHAAPGDRVPLGVHEVWAVGPDGQKAFENSLPTIGEIMLAMKDEEKDSIQDWSFQDGGLGHPARGALSIKIPMYFKQKGEVQMNVNPMQCARNVKGYLLDFDFSKSSSMATDNYSHLQIELCPAKTRSDGLLFVNATEYAIEGRHLGSHVGPRMLDYMKNFASIVLENAMVDHFKLYAATIDPCKLVACLKDGASSDEAKSSSSTNIPAPGQAQEGGSSNLNLSSGGH